MCSLKLILLRLNDIQSGELMSLRLQQPIANLAILFRAMKLPERQYGQQQQEVFHGSFLPTILTGS